MLRLICTRLVAMPLVKPLMPNDKIEPESKNLRLNLNFALWVIFACGQQGFKNFRASKVLAGSSDPVFPSLGE